MKEKFEYYRSRMKEAAEEALAYETEESRRELWDKLLNERSKYVRLVSALRLIKEFLPKQWTDLDRETIQSLFYYKKDLPFNPEKYAFDEKIGRGAQTDVYLLQSRTEKPSWVVKVAKPAPEGYKAEEQAKLFQEEYAQVREIYKDLPGLIPPEHVLMFRDPYYKNRAAAAVLQPFQHGEIRDFFTYSTEELKNLSETDPELGRNLEKFVQITLEHERNTGEVMDFLGPKNVSLVSNEQGTHLVVLDPHIIFSSRKEKDLERKSLLEERLEFLRELEEAA